jgi:hypothetical protein
MDIWTKLESNINGLREAGERLIGEKLGQLRVGGPSKEDQMRQYRLEELRRKWSKQWRTRQARSSR